MRDRNWLTMWILALIGGLLLAGGVGWMIYDNRQNGEANGWPSVQGRIDLSEVTVRNGHRRRGNRRSYTPRVEYRYTVAGTTYLNTYIWLTSTRSFSSRSGAQEVLQDYPVGAAVQVHYSPADPRRAALRIESDWGPAAILIGIGVLMLGFAWGLLRKVARTATKIGA